MVKMNYLTFYNGETFFNSIATFYIQNIKEVWYYTNKQNVFCSYLASGGGYF